MAFLRINTLFYQLRMIAFLVLIIPYHVFSQPGTVAKPETDSTKKSYFQNLIHEIQRGKNDSIRLASNFQFRQIIDSVLRNPASFQANFDTIKNISVLTAPDDKFKIYTWTLPYFDGNRYDYFGYIQVPSDSGNKIRLFPLQDSTLVIQKPQSEKLNSERWYGSVYYSLLENKAGKRTFYTILGWKGVNAISTQKVAEVLYFDHDTPRFGFPLFKTGKVYKNRLIFTFTAQSVMTLRYDDSKNMLVFDHLSGSSDKNQGSEDQTTIGGPDGTYDAMKFKKGKWILQQDVDVRTKGSQKKQSN